MIGYEMSEDCLYVNVVRPAGIDTSADLPVAVWIHGGGLVSPNPVPCLIFIFQIQIYSLRYIKIKEKTWSQ